MAVLAGCATITGSEHQSVSVHAVDRGGAAVSGSECRLNNDKGAWSVKPPGFVTVNKSGQDMSVRCEGPGQEPGLATVISRANSGLAGNILFGGGIGALIDHNKGTAYDYPNLIRVVFGLNRVIDKANEAPGSVPATAPVQPSLASPAAPSGNAGTGAMYRYAWSDRQYGNKRFEFQVRVLGATGEEVTEALTVGAGEGRATLVPAGQPAFMARTVADGMLVEFAPYMRASTANPGEAGPIAGYPADHWGAWQVRAGEPQWDEVVTPAGTFRAIRHTLSGDRPGLYSGGLSPAGSAVKTFQYTVWYAPEVKRYVKARHQVWNTRSSPIGDDHIELLEYRQP